MPNTKAKNVQANTPPQTKEQLVHQGQIEFGTFTQPIENVNLIDAKISSLPLPKWFRKLRLKEFQAFQGGNKRFFYCIALFNAKMSAFVQIRVFDIPNEKEYLYEKQLIPTVLNVPNNILNSTNSYESKGINIWVENKLENDCIQIKFKAAATKDLPALEGAVKGDFKGVDHLVVSVPLAENRGMYAHKAVVPMEGHMRIGTEQFTFTKNESFFILDDHKGYYPYRLKWDWLTTAFYKDGQRIGLNLTKNQSIDNENYNENALWIDKKMYKLPGINAFKREGKIWTITDPKGSIDLTFEALYPKDVKVNFGPFGASDYEGPMGKLSGTIKLKDGSQVNLDNVFAFAERMYIRC